MAEADKIAEGISKNLGAVFRHLLPGILIVGAARVAHPEWFSWVNLSSWQHIAVIAAIALTAGNVWFALNRYLVHQLIEYVLYRFFDLAGPIRKSCFGQDLGEYVTDSLFPEKIPERARRHVAFRASAILLIYTLAEVGFIFSWTRQSGPFSIHPWWWRIGSLAVFGGGIWQHIITERIDRCIVERGQTDSAPSEAQDP